MSAARAPPAVCPCSPLTARTPTSVPASTPAIGKCPTRSPGGACSSAARRSTITTSICGKRYRHSAMRVLASRRRLIRTASSHRGATASLPGRQTRGGHRPNRGQGAAAGAATPALFHRAVLCVRVAIIGEHLLDDFCLVPAVRAFRHLCEIEVLNGIVVIVEREGAT